MSLCQEDVKTRSLCHNPSSGFTILELILVMAVIALLSMTMMPLAWGYGDTVQLRLAAEEVANEIRLAQTMAQTRGRNVRLFFWRSGRITMTYDNDATRKPIKPELVLPVGISFDAISDRDLSFSSLGGVYYSGGAMNNAAWTTILMTRNKDKYYVIVAVNSGRVRVSQSMVKQDNE